MSFTWRPEPFVTHLGVTIYHAYKDEFSEIPLDYWYSTSEDALPGSEYEFDIRELRSFFKSTIRTQFVDDKELIQFAIERNFLNENLPVF